MSHCIGVSSGTDALRFALIAAGVRAGDGIITVAHTFAATVEAILQAKATPHFVEIEPDTIANWGQVPAYARALEGLRGQGAVAALAREAEPLMEGFVANARSFYKNFMKAVA